MAKLIFLGTSSAVASLGRENTHLLLVGSQSVVMVDCGGNPLRRLAEAEIPYQDLTDLILTHFHPDHVSGLPMLLMQMWILGRKEPLNIYGLHHTLLRVNKMMDLFDWEDWNNLFPVVLHHLPGDELAPVMEEGEFSIKSSPVQHMIPTLGLRIEHLPTGFTVAYSSDTDPCPATAALSRDADILIHEAAGAFPGHSTPEEAGGIAQQARAGALYLVHYPLHGSTREELAAAARKSFPGQVVVAQDLMAIDLEDSAGSGFTSLQ